MSEEHELLTLDERNADAEKEERALKISRLLKRMLLENFKRKNVKFRGALKVLQAPDWQTVLDWFDASGYWYDRMKRARSLDHIEPLKCAVNKKEWALLWPYKNLQPMPKRSNLEKGANLVKRKDLPNGLPVEILAIYDRACGLQLKEKESD